MAVQVCNASVSYRSSATSVLNGVCLQVDPGTIYCLLGSSGCGKTTLLSCITGMQKLDSGFISVFGRTVWSKELLARNILGYMPQDLCLHKYLTIGEMISLYGHIGGMKGSDLEKRVQFLIQLLQLRDSNVLISTLSGGQCRRVSLALALVHNPPLLILDEPVVGLDPLLRESIWNHLASLARNTTIILTTHYTEETIRCDRIGILRHGRIIADDTPLNLINKYNTLLIQDAVLKICKDDNEMAITHETQNLPIIENKGSFPLNDALGGSSGTIIYALLKRNLTSQIRNPMMICLQIMMPILQTLLGDLITGGDPKMVTLSLISSPYSCGQNSSRCFYDEDYATCSFIRKLNSEDISLNWRASMADGLTAIANGEDNGLLHLPSNFSTHLLTRFFEGNFATNESIDGSTITTRLDMSNAILGGFLANKIKNAYFFFLKEIAADCGRDSRLADIPLKFNPIYGQLEGGWEEYFQPSMIIDMSFLFPAAIISGFLVLDKANGTLSRAAAMGVSLTHTVVSAFLTQFLFLICQVFTLLAFLTVFSNLEINGSWLLFIGLLVLVGSTGITFGIFLATACSHVTEVMFIMVWMIFTAIFSTGSMWPMESVVPWFRYFCYIYPITLPLEGLRSIASRGWGLEHVQVSVGFGVLVGLSIIFVVMNYVVAKCRK